MDRKLQMKTAFIVDTCYLCELFKIPNHFNETSSKLIIEKFENAININSTIVIPVQCVYELANHIAHIANGQVRKNKAELLTRTVTTSIHGSGPWTISPHDGLDTLLKICEAFSDNYVIQGIGLSDSCVIEIAKTWKSKFKNNGRVYIWTKEASIKAHEPDTEAAAYLGH